MEVPDSELYEPGSRPELFRSPAVFLSASDPNRPKWADARHPARIRMAVTELCRWVFGRDWNLVFGGHPAISPLVLSAARHFVERARHRKRVLVFQSAFFAAVIAADTIELADWDQGELLWTARQPGPDGEPDRNRSLTWMREAMVRSPGLVAAVFIGGMEGVFEEEELFRRHQPGRPLYAIGSSGGAAEQLLATGRCLGGLEDTRLLASDLSYPWVFKTVFEDLEAAVT